MFRITIFAFLLTYFIGCKLDDKNDDINLISSLISSKLYYNLSYKSCSFYINDSDSTELDTIENIFQTNNYWYRHHDTCNYISYLQMNCKCFSNLTTKYHSLDNIYKQTAFKLNTDKVFSNKIESINHNNRNLKSSSDSILYIHFLLYSYISNKYIGTNCNVIDLEDVHQLREDSFSNYTNMMCSLKFKDQIIFDNHECVTFTSEISDVIVNQDYNKAMFYIGSYDSYKEDTIWVFNINLFKKYQDEWKCIFVL